MDITNTQNQLLKVTGELAVAQERTLALETALRELMEGIEFPHLSEVREQIENAKKLLEQS